MILDDILNIIKKNNLNNAYTIDNKTFTYNQFYKYVCNIYNFLLKTNKEKKPIIVYGRKQVYMKSVFLACSFAGMPYVPIDASAPKERIDRIIKQVSAEMIVGDININLDENIKIISTEKINEIMNGENYSYIENIYMKPDDIFYIIFTSGSTGIPKGVKVTYNNLNSCLNWLLKITKINQEVILNQANYSFDLSVADLYLSLLTGSEHYIIDNKDILDFKYLFENLKKSNATFAVMTPSYAELLLTDKSFNESLMPNLRTILFCGEKLNRFTTEKLYSRFNNLKIINTYGPTECTFAVTSIDIPKNIIDEIPIGKEKDDVKIYIVDDNLNELSEGMIGEILITGDSVSKGYIGNDVKNAFIEYKGAKGYLTGDLGYKKEGLLYYKCRKDRQIKYKGYRIELQDIEKNIELITYIEKAVVIAKKDEYGNVKRIIGFVKLKENVDKNISEIQNDLKLKLPIYMCPYIKIVKQFPLNENGKCDEKKLLEGY